MAQTDAMVAMGRRGEELKYVTEHFRDLQGLYFAWLWGGMLALSMLRSSGRISRGHLLIVIASFLALFLLVGIPCIRAWYRRYGVVERRDPQIRSTWPLSILNEKPAPRPSAQWSAPLLILASWILIEGIALFRSTDRYLGVLNLWSVLVLTIPRCFFYPTPNGFIQLRRALYIVGSAVIFFIIFSYPYVPAVRQLGMRVPEIICGTLVVLSLYDNWLLGHLLNALPEAGYE
jgi:hypothetical protein